MQRGFSLVELSIVLVILGLLTGGILTGQSLIRASELRSVVTQIQGFQSAAYSFRDKYFAMPGDMRNAESFWGTDPNGCPTNTVQTTRTQTCNGDGDGVIERRTVGTVSDERFRAWQQLANAGLIEGSYSGVPVGGTTAEVSPGVNSPRARFSNGLYSFTCTNDTALSSFMFSPIPTGVNVLMIGAYNGTSNLDGDSQIFTAEEAWNLDTKLDDGRPGMGKFQQYMNSQRPSCADTSVAATAVYQVSRTNLGCHGIWLLR